MKKFLLAVLLVTLAGLAGLTAWSRMRCQAAWQAGLAALAGTRNVAVLEEHFTPGWLASQGHVNLELRGAPGAAFRRRLQAAGQEDVRSRIGFMLGLHVEYGPALLWEWLRAGATGAPVLARIESTLRLDAETRADLGLVRGRVPGLQVSTRLPATGPGEILLHLAPAHLEPSGTEPREGEESDATRWTLTWQGLDGHLHFGRDGAWLTGVLRSPGYRYASSNGALRIVGWSARLDWRRDESGLPVGSTQWQLQRLALRRTAGDPARAPRVVELSGLTGNQEMQVSGEQWWSDTQLVLGGARLGSTQLGLGPGTASVALRGLDVARLKALLPLRGPGVAGTEELPTDQAPGGRAGASGDAWSELLAARPVLDLASLSLQTPEGELMAQGHLTLGPVPKAEPPAGTRGGRHIVDGSLDLRVPGGLVAAARKERRSPWTPLLDPGLLVPEGEYYRAHLSLRPGSFRTGDRAVDASLGRALRSLAEAPPKAAAASAPPAAASASRGPATRRVAEPARQKAAPAPAVPPDASLPAAQAP